MGSYTDLSSVLISIPHGSHGHHGGHHGGHLDPFSASSNGMSNGMEENKAVQVWFAAVLGGYFPGFPLDQHWEGSKGMFSPEQSMKQGRRTRRHRAQPSSALIFITNKDPV